MRFCCEISPSCDFVYVNWLKKSHLTFTFWNIEGSFGKLTVT
jgi:hypothetical protein